MDVVNVATSIHGPLYGYVGISGSEYWLISETADISIGAAATNTDSVTV
ncbi:hypothetical protein FRUB_03606 [Fimbriiglobus ruber]|uniref:Uncharacterized protein n=1 Tax=Fimbriiglobus ruber TaxID=1908690 RepID=A0A225E6E8_9BACT|nr:hypothetical protein FRUB_03606 [Fimbriiglobus ruber]